MSRSQELSQSRSQHAWGAAAIGTWLVFALNAALFDAWSGLWCLTAIGPTLALALRLPHSRISRYRAIAAGHLASAVVGLACAALVPSPVVAAGVAMGLAMGVMTLMDCEHPPGTATALIPVLGGPEVHALGWFYLVVPVLSNVIVAIGFIAAWRAWHGDHVSLARNQSQDS